MKLRLILMTFLFACSYAVDKDISFEEKEYGEIKIRTCYQDKKPVSSICITPTDSFKSPRIIKLTDKRDSVLVFIPINNFRNIDLFLGVDSAQLVRKLAGHSFHPPFKIQGIKTSTVLAFDSSMTTTGGQIKGAFWCTDSAGLLEIFAIDTRQNYR